MLKTLLVYPLFNILLLIYAFLPGHDFGLAVLVLTILMRVLLWPLVKKQLYHQKAMRQLQPEITKIKKAAKGDKQKESQMMVELFKEKEINPFGSIGLALAQFPILIALFFVLRHVVEAGEVAENAYSFVAQLPAVAAIINNPGAFDPTFFGYFHMAQPSLILAGLAGLAQYVQTKQITPHDTDKTNPLNQFGFNIILIFPIITVVIAAKLPSALALYWAASSLIAIYQQHKILKEDVSMMQKIAKTEPKS